MSLEMWMSNLWFYSLQTGILILVGGLLPWILRLQTPAILHLYWRLLMVACLLLALQPLAPISVPESVSVPLVEELVATTYPSSGVPGGTSAGLYPWLGGLLVTGILFRLIWLGVGFYRLHRLQRRTTRQSLPPHLQALEEEVGVSADYRMSGEVAGPVTFGWLRPVIILPESFGQLEQGMQRAVVCHELLHVKRRDWLWNTADELVRTLFWFHPAFHWLMRRIQLTREQVVDERVVHLLGSRKTYLQSLVEIAKRTTHAFSLPAPLFLEECQLRNRVRLLLQRPGMRRSKMKTALSLASCIGLLTVTGWWSLSALPLSQPQSSVVRLSPVEPAVKKAIPIRVGGNVMAERLLHRDDIEYPIVARVAGVEGLVMLRVLIDESGAVQEATVTRGHPALRTAALESVKQWRWRPFVVDGKAVPARTTVTINYVLRPDAQAPGLLLRIDDSGILWYGETALDEERLLHLAGSVGNVVVLKSDHDVPGTLIVDMVEKLKQSGIDRVFVLGNRPIEF